MRIKSIQLNNIGVFENELIEFKPCPVQKKAEIHVFTGTNGTGKSTLLKALVAAFEKLGRVSENIASCETDTNKITKYFRKKIVSRFPHCSANLALELVNDFEIIYTNCFSWSNHVHITTKDPKELSDYRKMSDESKKVDESNRFGFCIFAYSGNRFINISTESPNEIKHISNPLYESLEFDKNPNSAFFIDKWLETSLLKESYASREGLSLHSKNFIHILTKLEKAIGEIVGFDVKIKMDEDTLSKPVFFYDHIEHNLDVLPDGLKSILSWLLDLSMRMEKLTWVDDTPLFDRNIILFLDEVEAHLHIEWQRKILPVIQKLLPNAQIFVSTHSPFVVNSVDDAWVYNLEVKKGNAKVRKIELSQDGRSIASVLRNIFGVNETFGVEVENDLAAFRLLLKKAEATAITDKEEKELYKLSEKLAEQGTELSSIVSFELRQLEKLNKNFALK